MVFHLICCECVSSSTLACRDLSEEKLVKNFLEEEGIAESKKIKILSIIKGMGEFEFISQATISSICVFIKINPSLLVIKTSYYQSYSIIECQVDF